MLNFRVIHLECWLLGLLNWVSNGTYVPRPRWPEWIWSKGGGVKPKNLSQCYCVHHKSHESGRGDTCARQGPESWLVSNDEDSSSLKFLRIISQALLCTHRPVNLTARKPQILQNCTYISYLYQLLQKFHHRRYWRSPTRLQYQEDNLCHLWKEKSGDISGTLVLTETTGHAQQRCHKYQRSAC